MLGYELKRYREKQGISGKQLAELIGVSGATISYIESGRHMPSLSNLIKIGQVLNIPANVLLDQDTSALIVSEDEEYKVRISKEDLKIINLLKLYPEAYNKLCKEPERTISKMIINLK